MLLPLAKMNNMLRNRQNALTFPGNVMDNVGNLESGVVRCFPAVPIFRLSKKLESEFL